MNGMQHLRKLAGVRVALRLVYAIILVLLSLEFAQAQQREFYNGGFEQNDPKGPGTPSFKIYNNADVPEWSDETGKIELWDTGFQGITSFEGNVHAEMNANAPGTLYQEVCLVAGETLGWTFAHRARSGGSNPQTALFEIADAAGTLIQSLATQNSFIGNPWSVNTGTTTYNGATGTQRVQFRSTSPSSIGNFVDDMRLNIAAFAQLDVASSADKEADGANIPAIILEGRVEVTTNIPVSITGGTATAADYTLSAAFVTIPPGLYRAHLFPLPVIITDELADEPDETIELSIGTPDTAEIVLAQTICDGSAPQTTATYTIENDDTTLSGDKTVEIVDNGAGNDYAIPGNEAIYTITIMNTGTEAADSDSLFLADTLPSEVELFTGDFDGPGPSIGAVEFTETGSGLTWDAAADYGFSDQVTKPANMGACNYAPVSAYDDAVKHICFAPSGVFASGPPDPVFSVRFRTRIR